MSDAVSQSLKVSREGIVLIKSFEGFRPRAIQRQEGGWVIGYGHTLSAREGATVSEADAELLLRYDLLPVEKSLNETLPAALNQHQFDALASFAFSVGLDRFATSDVRQRLTAGAPAEAAEAMLGWPEPALPDTALRRRAAERALFSADPASPVALADLLATPLPPPPVVPEPVETVALEAEPDVQADTETVDPRGAAVATLLGEIADPIEADETAPVESEPAAFVVPVIAPTAPPVDAEPTEAETAEVTAVDAEPQPAPEPTPETASSEEAVEPIEALAEDAPAEAVVTPVEAEDVVEVATAVEAPVEPEPATDDASADAHQRAMAMARFSPYGAGMMGPLPYLRPAAPRLVQTEAEVEPATGIETASTAKVEAAPEPSTPLVEEIHAVAFEEPPVVAEPEVAQTYIAPMAYMERASAADAAPILHIASAPLVLTPMEDAPEPAVARALWTPEQRVEPASAEGGLFGEDLSLTQSVGPVLGQEFDAEPPVRFDWSETGAFIIMGAVGLTAFGASMAAFRLASEQSNGGAETTMIAWVLAVIGAACVGVSSFNLYRRWGLPGGD